ncbi:MAG TPA: hypothetical protein VGQ83_09260 [Polyangia bacterium]|jgi:hypothetical protein
MSHQRDGADKANLGRAPGDPKHAGPRPDESVLRQDTTEGEDFDQPERKDAGPRSDEPVERSDTTEGEDFDLEEDE